jgi:hypothetical protein
MMLINKWKMKKVLILQKNKIIYLMKEAEEEVEEEVIDEVVGSEVEAEEDTEALAETLTCTYHHIYK